MDAGEQTTRTRDEHYNLISVLYHALHGAENCEIYAVDAEVTGRDELAAFFREAQATQMQLAERAKGLLGIPPEVARTDTVPADAGDATVRSEVAMGDAAIRNEILSDAPTEEIPLTTDVPRTPPRGTPGDVERGAPPEPAPPGEERPPGPPRPGGTPG